MRLRLPVGRSIGAPTTAVALMAPVNLLPPVRISHLAVLLAVGVLLAADLGSAGLPWLWLFRDVVTLAPLLALADRAALAWLPGSEPSTAGAAPVGAAQGGKGGLPGALLLVTSGILIGFSLKLADEAALPRIDVYAVWVLLALAGVAAVRAGEALLRRLAAWRGEDEPAAADAQTSRQATVGASTARQRLLKKVFDRSLALLLLVVLAPVFAAIALAIKVTSPGPVLFAQPRYGLNRWVIRVYKFRTLHWHRCDPPDAKVVVPIGRHDPRVTPVGRFLRRTSLDELPQLFNVLEGQMSLVGPRPHAIPHDELFASQLADYWDRYRVKPGLTGWAQVKGLRGEIRHMSEMQDRLAHDLHYIAHASIWFDLWIIAMTCFCFFRQPKAY